MSFWSLGLQTHYCCLPPGIFTVLVSLILCLMMVPVITAEWLSGNLSMTLELYGEVGKADRRKRKRESMWSFWHRRVE